MENSHQLVKEDFFFQLTYYIVQCYILFLFQNFNSSVITLPRVEWEEFFKNFLFFSKSLKLCFVLYFFCITISFQWTKSWTWTNNGVKKYKHRLREICRVFALQILKGSSLISLRFILNMEAVILSFKYALKCVIKQLFSTKYKTHISFESGRLEFPGRVVHYQFCKI